MTKYYANDLIKVAKKYVGYLEKETNKDLEDKTSNAGDENYTIFAVRFKEISGINNQHCAWCDMFVDTCFAEAFGKDKAKELLGGFSAYTPTSAQYFKNMNQWYTSDPKVGDVIFYHNSERICHTGIVQKVDKTTVYTIEGNTSAGKEIIPNGGGVFEKAFLLSNPRISGYGRPKYDISNDVKPTTVKEINPYKQPTSTVRKGDNGDSVKWVQYELIEAKIDSVVLYGKVKKIKVDGDFGEISEEAVKIFQRKNKLAVDGVVGKNTIKAFVKTR